MADNFTSQIVETVTTPQHYSPPSAREARAQSVHRLQVGLIGLCAMTLIVALANIIMDRAKPTDEQDPVEQIIAADAQPKKPASDPLADIGVVPSADPAPAPPTEPMEDIGVGPAD